MPKKFDQHTKNRVVSLGGRPRAGGEYGCAGNMQNWGTQTGGLWHTARQWAQTAHRLRDGVLVERISAVHRDNYGVYGVRKMWHALRREGINIGREHTARLMRLAGVSGKGKGRSPITTCSPQHA